MIEIYLNINEILIENIFKNIYLVKYEDIIVLVKNI